MSELRDSVSESLSLLELDRISPLVARDQILAAFKAHIEGCEKPENPYNKTDTLTYGQFLHKGFREGVEADRKALMESLE